MATTTNDVLFPLAAELGVCVATASYDGIVLGYFNPPRDHAYGDPVTPDLTATLVSAEPWTARLDAHTPDGEAFVELAMEASR